MVPTEAVFRLERRPPRREAPGVAGDGWGERGLGRGHGRETGTMPHGTAATGSRREGEMQQDASGMSESELAEIEARTRRASPAPWKAFVEGRDHYSGEDFIRIG